MPGRARRRDYFFDTHVPDALLEGATVDSVAITHQEARRFVERKRFCDLLSRPFSGRMRCDVEVYDLSSIMAQDDETEQDTKRGRRHREEINRHDVASMVLKKDAPCLGRRLAKKNPVFVNGRLGNGVAPSSPRR